MGRLPRDRVRRRRRRRRSSSRNDNDLTARFPDVAKAIGKALRTPNACSTARSARSTSDGRATLLRDAAGQAGHAATSTYVFDVLEIDGEPVVDLAATPSGASGSRGCSTSANTTVQFSETFDDGEALLRGREAAALRGDHGQAPALALPARAAHARLAEDQGDEQPGVRDRRLHARGRPARGQLRLARSSASSTRAGTSSCTPATSAPASTTREIEKLLDHAPRRSSPDEPPFDPVPKPPRVRKGDISLGASPKLVAEVEFVEWTHDAPPARARRTRGCARTRARARCTRRSRCRPSSARATACSSSRTSTRSSSRSSGSRRATCSRTTARSHRCSCRTSRTGRSRWSAVPTGSRASASSRRTRRRTCPSGSRRSARSSRRVSRRGRKKWVNFPLVNDELALLWMVNMGCIDMNAWYSRVDKPERPDFVLFDLDPSPDVGFKETVQVALLVKAGARRIRARRLPEDLERRGDARARADRAALHVRGHASLRGDRRRARSRDRTAGSRRRSGRSRSGAACSSTRTRTARGRRSPRSTRCGRAEARRSRRRCAGRRSTRTSTRCRSRWTSVRDRIEEHGDLFEGVLTTKQRLTEALKSLT